MSEMTFEQMLEASFKTIHTGEVVEGTVIDVKANEAILNIGYKADGVLTKSEYTNDPSVVLTDAINVGDTMEVKVLKVNDGEGQVLLTYKRLAADRGSKRLEEAFESGEILKATVSQVLDGGICVVLMKRIFPSMQEKKLNSLSQSTILRSVASSETARFFLLLVRKKLRRSSLRQLRKAM